MTGVWATTLAPRRRKRSRKRRRNLVPQKQLRTPLPRHELPHFRVIAVVLKDVKKKKVMIQEIIVIHLLSIFCSCMAELAVNNVVDCCI